jgi:Asp/Glu/hydantoin racemase
VTFTADGWVVRSERGLGPRNLRSGGRSGRGAEPPSGRTSMARVRGGQNLYGFSVGILMLDTRFPRIPGDMGHAATFDFPVRYHRVAGASPERVVRQSQRDLLPSFVEGARFLEREGVGAITTNCGFLAKFQPELAAAVSVPVFTSSLMLVPLVHRLLAPGRAVGILTVDAGSLHEEHLRGAGIGPEVPVVVAGLESEKEFTRVLLGDQLELDVDTAREEHLAVVHRMLAAHPEIGAIVLECTNMPPYRVALQEATGLPVFDITALVRMVHGALQHGLPPRPA